MGSGDPTLEEVRRRVYSPGATDDDRAEYRRLLGGADEQVIRQADPGAAEPEDAAPAVGPPTARRRRRALVAGGLAALVVLAAVIVSVLPRAAPAAPVPTPTPVSVDPGTRGAFLDNLDAGRAAGLLTYLRSERRETSLRDATRFATVEQWGSGPESIPIRPVGDVPAAGRVTVILVVRSAVRAAWTLSALRPYLRADDPSNRIGTRAGDAEPGTPTFAIMRYRSTTVPATLRVDVPKGVAWGAAVVLSD